MIKKIKSNKEKVTNYLKKFPAYRNSDAILIGGIWRSEIKNLNKLSAKDLLSMLKSGKISNPETIRRCRQKVQQENPSLRGKNYSIRHKIATDVRKNINKLF